MYYLCMGEQIADFQFDKNDPQVKKLLGEADKIFAKTLRKVTLNAAKQRSKAIDDFVRQNVPQEILDLPAEECRKIVLLKCDVDHNLSNREMVETYTLHIHGIPKAGLKLVNKFIIQ